MMAERSLSRSPPRRSTSGADDRQRGGLAGTSACATCLARRRSRGQRSDGPLAIAQPAGTFTATGNMITPRFGHTATLLPKGKVLIAGGYTFCYFDIPCLGPKSAELYDPMTGTFAATGSMTTAHPTRGILLPDGRVLLTGRVGASMPVVVGAELYDPA